MCSDSKPAILSDRMLPRTLSADRVYLCFRGAKYNVHYDVLDHATSVPKVPKMATGDPEAAWGGWENGMLLALDGQWAPPPPVHDDDRPAGLLLALQPSGFLNLDDDVALSTATVSKEAPLDRSKSNRTKSWRRVTGSFVAAGPDTTIVLHAEPESVAHFDHVSVAVESHNADDLPLIQTDEVRAAAAAAAALCEPLLMPPATLSRTMSYRRLICAQTRLRSSTHVTWRCCCAGFSQ